MKRSIEIKDSAFSRKLTFFQDNRDMLFHPGTVAASAVAPASTGSPRARRNKPKNQPLISQQLLSIDYSKIEREDEECDPDYFFCDLDGDDIVNAMSKVSISPRAQSSSMSPRAQSSSMSPRAHCFSVLSRSSQGLSEVTTTESLVAEESGEVRAFKS